ncbi:MAG: hypothetical protein LBP78_07260 [Acidaminococcales bacterium]|jgi:hypothetical protein|nr:hypothetical protein [Acidaminococcales bacterium]
MTNYCARFFPLWPPLHTFRGSALLSLCTRPLTGVEMFAVLLYALFEPQGLAAFILQSAQFAALWRFEK